MSPGWRLSLPALIGLVAVLLVGACAPTRNGQRFDGIGAIFTTDLSARQPTELGGGSAGGARTLAASGAREQVFHGSQFAGREQRQQSASTFEPGEFSLNFQNADIREVVQTILGQTLGENYTIDPSVGGTISISSARPLSRDELIPALEVALQSLGAALVKHGNLYRITIETSAAASTTDYLEARPGYGISLIPLEHVSARTLIGLIEGFGVRPGSVRAEARRNLLIVFGNSADRQAAIETALNFDADWMENQSVAILPLRHAKPETVIPELERIFASRSGDAGADLVQFMSMQRLKAVLVVSPRRELIDRARGWAQRLDTDNPDLNANVYVYRVKYRDAAKLAGLLSSIFGGGGAFAPETPGEQIEPGAEPVSVEGFIGEPGQAGQPAPFGEDLIAGPGGGTGIGGAPQEPGDGRGPRVRIQADTANNSLVIYADLETRQQILAALNRIDVPQLQVAINVTMAEIRLEDELRHGVQYFIRSQSVGLERDGSAGLFGGLVNRISRDLPGFNFVLGSEASPEVIISAFQGLTDVQVLSSPSLVVVENETARFQVGDQIPIVTRTVTSVQDPEAPVSNEIEYRDTGVILSVKPRIAENGVVSLDIAQEVSSVSGGSATLTPTISKRRVESTISVVDGQTVLLGGLIGEQTSDGRGGIPGLSRIPAVGNLFRNRVRQGTRTELIILIRPSVIRGSEDAQHVAEELRARMWRARQGY
ncbi:MAG: type II secretion system secretin GspD [Propylenella sp.]